MPNIHSINFRVLTFTTYNDWNVVEDTAHLKVHETIRIPHFFDDHSDLTLQFTIENYAGAKKEINIVRIYKGGKTLQSFRKGNAASFWPYHVTSQPVKVADLNGDGRKDLRVLYDYHGNGLSLRYRLIYFIQDKNNTFKKYAFDCSFDDRIDLERDFDHDGKFEIQSVTLFNQNHHNYWCFRVFQLRDEGLVEVSDRLNYPLFIQFLHKRNYRAAGIQVPRELWAKDLTVAIDKGIIIE